PAAAAGAFREHAQDAAVPENAFGVEEGGHVGIEAPYGERPIEPRDHSDGILEQRMLSHVAHMAFAQRRRKDRRVGIAQVVRDDDHGPARREVLAPGHGPAANDHEDEAQQILGAPVERRYERRPTGPEPPGVQFAGHCTFSKTRAITSSTVSAVVSMTTAS